MLCYNATFKKKTMTKSNTEYNKVQFGKRKQLDVANRYNEDLTMVTASESLS